MKKILSVLLVAVMVLAVVPFTASAAANWTTIADTANAYSNLDYVSSADFNDILLSVGGGNGTDVSVNIAKGSKTHVTFFGWFALDTQDIAAYGYSINGATTVYEAAFKGSSVAVGQKYSARYYTKVPVTGLSEGTHKLYNYVKLADGSEYIVGTINLTLTATAVAGETVPSLYTGDLSVMNIDFQDSALTNGFDIMTTGNPIRSKWSPRTAGGNASTVVVDGSNKYVKLDGFMELTPDYRWNCPYEFSVDVKGYANSSASIFLNYANDSAEATSVDTDTHFPLSEGPFAGTAAYSGQTGIFIRLVNATTMEIGVYTFDETNTHWDSYAGKIATTVTVPSLDSFQTINVKDDNQGKIIIAVAGNVVATIKYSNDGVYNNFACGNWGDLSERYYKTATIYDAAGSAVATTDKALVSYYKRVGFGTRQASFCIDNIKVGAYTAPATSLAVSMPTDIVAKPGSTITVPVVLTGDAAIIYANGTVKYNSALTYTGYSVGDVFTKFDSSSKISNSATDKEVNFIVMDGDFAERTANGTLIKLKFTVPANAANGTVYSFEYVPSTIGDAFLDMDETEFLPTSNTAGKVTVEATEVEAPEAIELVTNSNYTVDETYDRIVIRAASNSGESLDTFKANIATDSAYIQYLNGSNVVTSASRLSTKYSVQLLDANGNLVKTYELVVIGDLDGNGRFTGADVNNVNLCLESAPAKGTAEFVAANCDGNSRLTGADVNALETFLSSNAWK
jgi:hypothetical protein